ncbi:MAG: hypothetical protein KI790_02895 [Cyclobacteriaceae bacterium]|nr:hypothetical protein [Cyclobacteriaceae bacterium HetDA_MAG_MS6]
MKKYLSIMFFVASVFAANAQLDFDNFLEAGVDDANKLFQGYLEPAFTGFGYGINNGWYNTGKPHKILGFDITTNFNLANVPSEAEFFTFNNSDYTNVQVSNGTSADLPTLFGPNLDADDIPELVFNQGTVDEVRVTAPTGAGIDEADWNPVGNVVPSAMVQIGIGLIKNTELKLRIVPEQTFGDPGSEVSFKMNGFGIMHDIKQWIPGMKLLPFDLSGFFGYSKITTTFQLDEDRPDQKAEMEISGVTVQGIISKKLALLTVFAGVGFNSTSSSFAMLGNYDNISSSLPDDPINLEFDSSGMRANIGARLKLLILTLHAEYALQKYNTLTVGLGLSIR